MVFRSSDDSGGIFSYGTGYFCSTFDENGHWTVIIPEKREVWERDSRGMDEIWKDVRDLSTTGRCRINGAGETL